MLKNYIKLAWRVLSRKKFFTFITLFGISFTLMILMLITSYFQAEFGNRAPMQNQDDLVILDYLTLQKINYDTLMVIDTLDESGVALYDTTYDLRRTGRNNSTSSFNEKILNTHFRNLESVEATTIFNTDTRHDVFINNSKLQISVNHCDEQFWNIFKFKFVEGRPFDVSDVDQQAQVAVISRSLAMSYFGKESGVLDKSIEIDAKQFKIIGVVEDPTSSPDPITMDMFVPYTHALDTYQDPYFGSYSMALLSKGNLEKTKDEIIFEGQSISLDLQEDYNELVLKPVTYPELYARELYYDEDPSKSLKYISFILLGLISLFILLPVLNLINLNVSRIMDRSSEIGVRKAFGATQSDILSQFIFENIIQTLLGGLIGFVFAFLAISIINQSKYLGTIVLEIDLAFFFYSILICLVFGVLSGLLPALKMSKLQIVNALKTNQL